MEKYLGSGLIKGVRPVTAKRIVAHFGFDALDVTEHSIERLKEVPGITKKRVKMIQEAWDKQKAYKRSDGIFTRSWCFYYSCSKNLQNPFGIL